MTRSLPDIHFLNQFLIVGKVLRKALNNQKMRTHRKKSISRCKRYLSHFQNLRIQESTIATDDEVLNPLTTPTLTLLDEVLQRISKVA